MINSKARIWRIIATGTAAAAVFAPLGATGTASAAVQAWSATTKASAYFRCIAHCQAGGVGYVEDYDLIGPPPDSPTIGAWERTVLLRCKVNSINQAYQGTVQDKNWSGTWQVMPDDLNGKINDGPFPVC